MKVFFIRHGETTGDVENRYGGAYDDHLTEKGREQSIALAEQLRDSDIEIIFTSSLIRAQETAGILASKTECPIEVADNLRERNQYGILSGMVKSEAAKQYPEMVEMLKDRYNTIEGAESYEAFAARISETFARLIASQHKAIAMVSHGGPLRVLCRDILKLGELKEIGNCAFVELEMQSDGSFKWLNSGALVTAFEIPVS